VPGCRNAVFLDLHHRKLRSRGGENTLENLVTLCGAHHRAVHYGRLFVESTPAGLRFLHADGRDYGSLPAPALIDARAKAVSALTLMGFSAKQVRAALAKLSGDSAPNLEQLIRQGLAALG
jgi:hypothetical protein